VTTATASEKYEIVTPTSVRDSLQVKPGQKLEMIVYERRVALVPVQDLRVARIDTEAPREADRV
jgi:AbrB family looped-hinge helix DNA binding protein